MKRIYLFAVLICKLSLLSANQYAQIDQESKIVPPKLKTASEIAQSLCQNSSTPSDKARAIYVWIATNVKYDLSMLNAPKSYRNSQELVDEVLIRRQGVCQNYAELFHACCKAVGVKSYVIVGYTRDSLGRVSSLGHAWNAVEIDNTYRFIDVAWAAGYVQNGVYVHRFRDLFFMRTPADFIRTHIPFDPLWQFMDFPVLHENFINGDFSRPASDQRFHYQDTLHVFERLSDLGKKQGENRRIQTHSIPNRLIKDRLENNKLFIENELLNHQKEMVNKAAALFSSGVNDYNTYIGLLNKNRGDKSKITSSAHLLSNARSQISAAIQLLASLSTTDVGLKHNRQEMTSNSIKIISSIDDLLKNN